MNDNETLHLAKLICWPQLRFHYQNFQKEITSAFSNPSYQAIYESLCSQDNQRTRNSNILGIPTGQNSQKTTPKTSNYESLDLEDQAQRQIDELTHITISKLQKRQTLPKTRTGEAIKTSTTSVCQALEKLRETCQRMKPDKATTQDKIASEDSLKNWLERSIVQMASAAEPTTLASQDPIQSALSKLVELRESKALFAEKEEEISFPLESLTLFTKPKLPTGFEPFDQYELEGGADEDTTMILSGETNIGKSHLGLFCLSGLSLRRQAVLLCSGEDSIETTKKRVFSHYIRKTSREVSSLSEAQRLKIMTDLYGDREDPESLHHHITKNFAIACIAEGNFSAQTVAEKIDAFEQKRQVKVKAFMCDYLQKMSENPLGKSLKRMRDEELEFCVNQIKDLCQERKAFGLVISQVPSHAAGGAGGQEFLNLRQAVARSYAATWGAHYVVTINRPSEETRRLSNSPDKRPRLNLFLCKNKDGPLGVCHTLGYPEQARWEFYRSKTEMERHIESQKANQAYTASEAINYLNMEDIRQRGTEE